MGHKWWLNINYFYEFKKKLQVKINQPNLRHTKFLLINLIFELFCQWKRDLKLIPIIQEFVECVHTCQRKSIIRILNKKKLKINNYNKKQLTEKLVYMPRVGIEPTSPSFLVRSVNHYTIRDHHAGNVAVWLVKLVNTWGFLGPIFSEMQMQFFSVNCLLFFDATEQHTLIY